MITDLFKRLAQAIFKRVDTAKFIEDSVGKKPHPVRSSEDVRSSPETQWIPQKPLTSTVSSANQKRLDSHTPLATQTPLASQTPPITRSPLAQQAPRASLAQQALRASQTPLTTPTPLGPQRSLASETLLSYQARLASRSNQPSPRSRSPLLPETPAAHQTAQAMEIIQAVQMVEDSSHSGKDSEDEEPPSLKQNEKDKEEDLDDMPTWRDPHARKAIITSKGMGRSINV